MKPILTAILVTVSLPAPGAPGARLEVAGSAVIPHVPAREVEFRRPADPPRGARVQLFLRNPAAPDRGEEGIFQVGSLRIDGSAPREHIEAGAWSWHDTPPIWKGPARKVPAGSLIHWTWNRVEPFQEGIRNILMENARTGEKEALQVDLRLPRVWLAAVTFLGPEEKIYPDRVLIHLRNASRGEVRIRSLRIWLPRSGATFRHLFPRREVTGLDLHPRDGKIPPGDTGCVFGRVGPLPLTYAAVELRLEGGEGKAISLWSHLRIKKEVFDIGGGWISSDRVPGGTLRAEPYLKTLKRIHVSSGMHGEVGGYTDQTGPEGLYTRYPIKMMNRLQPIERFDRDDVLPRIHAVEFIGEPQYQARRRGHLPPAVFEAFRPYAPTRLATSVTLSDASTWHLWAGLSDYPHYDAYRVTAPMADSWRKYDRWKGRRIGWGAPLETIGDMTRSLRENSRPAPIAYWSQGPHAGWRGYDGRRRPSPTPDEIRLQAYHGLSSRITSLYWFNLSLPSIVKFRDTLEELERIGREIRLLQDYYLEGCAHSYRRDGDARADLAVIAAPRGALLFALDLDYTADAEEKVFRFGPPRPVRLEFALPLYLRPPRDVFRVDSGGLHECRWEPTGSGLRIEDRFSRVGIWVAAPDRRERERLARRLAGLIACERAFQFDPARNDEDFQKLQDLLGRTF